MDLDGIYSKNPLNSFQIGKTYQAWQSGAAKPYKIHVVAIVDEEYIVYKYYGKYKQWWHYKVDHWKDVSFDIYMASKNS